MNTNFLKRFGLHSFYLTSLCSMIMLSQLSCSSFQELRDRRNKAEADLEVICKKIPIPSDFVKADAEKNLDIGKVAIFKNYKSKSSCNVVGEYYRNYFIGESWDQNRMTVRQRRGGMETLDFDFRNGDYLISVECQNDVGAEAQKVIGISCSWGLR